MRWTALLLALWMAVGAAAAQEGDEADRGGEARPTQAPAESSYVGRGLDSPTFVMLRSVVFPGWGQAKNGAWLKAIVIAAGEGALLERVYYENRVSHHARDKAELYPVDSVERARLEAVAEKHASRRRDFIWWSALCVVLSMGDAYVDAHLKRFEVRVQTDEDRSGLVEPAAGSALAVRVGFRFMGAGP